MDWVVFLSKGGRAGDASRAAAGVGDMRSSTSASRLGSMRGNSCRRSEGLSMVMKEGTHTDHP